MSAFGSTLNFGVKIGVQDDSRRGVSSFLSNIQSMARTAIKPITIPLQIGRGALGLLRDINLGLAPVVRGLDHLLTRGGALEVQQKAFESLTGRSGRQAQYLARRLQEASSGTLRLGEAMALANRAMSSGMNLDQLAVAIEFIGKKSVATGKDARQAMDTVITGLIRGSTLFLDDFGILVDGLDGVKRSFDSIHGRGAFESLGPAAQKAETVRQAIEEMRGQMGAINVSGRETVFLYAGIKTQIGDAVDKLVLAVAKSDAMKSALTGVRDMLAGISQHFSEINPKTGMTGTFGELFFGKEKSGGIFGLIKAGLMDAGEALGRGMLAGALKAMAEIIRLLAPADETVQRITDEVEQDKGLDRGPIFTNWLGGRFELMRRLAGQPVQGSQPTRYDTPPQQDMIVPPFSGGRAPATNNELWSLAVGSSATAGRGPLEPDTLRPRPQSELSIGGLAKRFWKWFAPEYYHTIRGLQYLPIDFLSGGRQSDRSIWQQFQLPSLGWWDKSRQYKKTLRDSISMGGLPMNPMLAAASAMGSAAIGAGDGGGIMAMLNNPKLLANALDVAADNVLSGGGGRLAPEWANFQQDFPRQTKEELRAGFRTSASPYRLTMHARLSALRRMGVIKDRLRNIRSGGAFTRQMALRDTAEEVARLRGEGNHIGPRERREIFERMLGQRQDAAAKPLNAEFEKTQQRLQASDARFRANKVRDFRVHPASETESRDATESSARTSADAAKSVKESVSRMETLVQQQTAVIGRFVSSMTGAENELAAIAGKA